MKQFYTGLFMYVFMATPPVRDVLESIMIMHMHMQMPLLMISGFLMAPFLTKRCPRFFDKWNGNGIPGILLFAIINLYWMIPRAMDDALTIWFVEVFKFVSLPFLAGVPLRDSWPKISNRVKNIIMVGFTTAFIGLGLLYTITPVQLCNNYLLDEQITLGWGYITMAITLFIFLIYSFLIDPSEYE